MTNSDVAFKDGFVQFYGNQIVDFVPPPPPPPRQLLTQMFNDQKYFYDPTMSMGTFPSHMVDVSSPFPQTSSSRFLEIHEGSLGRTRSKTPTQMGNMPSKRETDI